MNASFGDGFEGVPNPEMINGSPAVAMFTAPNPGSKTLEGTNTFVIGHERSYVVDPGPAIERYQESLASWIRQEGHHVQAILLTHGHPDHAPGAARLAELLGCAIVGSAEIEASAYQPVHVDRHFVREERFQTDGDTVDVVETPGHSSDHVAFWLRAARILFAGDTILGRGTSLVAPPEGDMTLYMQTLQHMQELRPRLIAPGHGPLIRDPAAKLAEYISHRLERERQIMDLLEANSSEPREIVAVLYEDVDSRLHDLALGSVMAHLQKLEREGRVRRNGHFYRRT
jgi:glyoxylase-like metal-dependent hydrolase (beta-lactamase superfamily II)